FHCAAAQTFETISNALVQPPQILVFIPERFAHFSTALVDSLGELDHLVNGLLAVLTHDVVVEHLPGCRFGLTPHWRQHFEKHGHHHLDPAFANQRKGAVEIEQHVADAGTRCEAGAEFNQAVKGTCAKHSLDIRIGFPQKASMRGRVTMSNHVVSSPAGDYYYPYAVVYQPHERG